MTITVHAWRKSTFSGTNGGECVEVAPTASGVLIRHSKHLADGIIEFTSSEWDAFVAAAVNGNLPAVPAISVSQDGTDTLVSDQNTATTLRYTASEWSAFVAGAAKHEFVFA
jgi:hypothetical protein